MVERPLLTWDDVRALAGAIHPEFECLVWTAAAIGLRFGESAVRTVPLAEVIANRLAVHVEQYVGSIERNELVFTSLRGGPLLSTYFAPQWSKARDAVGLRHVRFHDLRHLAGTEAATAGGGPRGGTAGEWSAQS